MEQTQQIQDSTKPQERLVVKKDGSKQAFDRAKLMKRVEALQEGLETQHMRIDAMIDKVCRYAHHEMTTADLDKLLAETAAYMNMVHPDCGRLGARVAVTNLHKKTHSCFKDVIDQLYHYKGDNGENASLIADDVYQVVQKNHERLNAAIDYKRDLDYDYFGFKTLEKGYLLKVHNKVVERPQHMIMRVALGIHKADIESAINTYHLISERWFTHATPTLFNAGTPRPQMSSCFLLAMKDDSIDGIYATLHQTALISKSAGGIGLSAHNIRSTGTYIKGTNGISNGLIPMLKVFNETARYVDQGGGKRKGSFAIYLEPWHADVMDFLQLKKNHGKEENRARDLFYALWVPDLFMKRVMEDGDWTLMCPNKCPGLHECHGAKFEELYLKYESEGRGNQTIKAQQLWQAIIESQIETGTPYMMFKDHANAKSNQQNLGTIKSSNLCCEIIEYTSKDEVAVCNLASICLPKFVKADGTFDHVKLHEVSRTVAKNLNRIIDANYYPIEEARNSNMRHRPIGIGIQGLADALILMKVAYEDEVAEKINAEIFETIYHAAMEESVALAKVEGAYQTFKGSPLSEGKFQFDLWNEKPASDRYDWDTLRKDVIEFGARNSLLIAPMPTASTAQIMSNNESFEPYTTNIYTRRVLSGEFICVNPHLVRDMVALGIWDNESRNQLVADQGSVQNLKRLPDRLKAIYKTIWEISQKQLIKLARCRAPFICQSQSLNIYFAEPSHSKLSASHIYAWKSGLKTGQYYMRSRPARDAIQFTLDLDAVDVKTGQTNYNQKNLSKKEMSDARRAQRAKKRARDADAPVEDAEVKTGSVDLNKRRKMTEEATKPEVKEPAKSVPATEPAATSTAATPWADESKWQAEPEDDRWHVCTNCQ